MIQGNGTKVVFDCKCQKCGRFKYTMTILTGSDVHVAHLLASRNSQFCMEHHPPVKPRTLAVYLK